MMQGKRRHLPIDFLDEVVIPVDGCACVRQHVVAAAFNQKCKADTVLKHLLSLAAHTFKRHTIQGKVDNGSRGYRRENQRLV